MNILALSTSHCSSAALMIDGVLVGMIQEERLTKRKNQVALPLRSAEALVDRHLGGDRSRIDQVIFGGRRDSPYWVALDHYSAYSVADQVREMHEFWYPHFYGDGADPDEYWLSQIAAGRNLNPDHNFDFSFLGTLRGEKVLEHFNEVERPAAVARWLGRDTSCVMIDHHKCHGYWALYGSAKPCDDLEQVLVVTADAMGDTSNWSVSVAHSDGTLELIAHGLDHDVARIYKFVTLILGMKPNEHEYKVMGLAPYSRSSGHIEAVERVFDEILDFREGRFVSDRPLTDRYFNLKERLEGHRFDNIAAGLQNWTTRITQSWLRHWIIETGRPFVCFSGGLAMNIRTNGHLLEMPEISGLSVSASGGDESLPGGACYAHWAETVGPLEPAPHVYLGDTAEPIENWEHAVEEAGGDPTLFAGRSGIDAQSVAQLLAADNVVARCVGPAEFGARALGNRSILANPSNPDNVKFINDAIKNRDFWMPFTPSILVEYADDYLENPKGVQSPYMTIGFSSQPERRHEIIGGLHPSDFSARPQFIRFDQNPEYWTLVDEFRQLTGIPAVMNTSLNLHGEPMNYTSHDALRTLVLSELDFLILPGDKLVYRRRAERKLDIALRNRVASAG
ncbi:MAG: hypothetical protein CL569_16485 [Alphaproteobacteria bacterium]|nr:hypothetical protein [Alphaproteobacteria bacterium]